LLADFQALSRDQGQALETRLKTLTANEPSSSKPASFHAAASPPGRAEYAVSSALQEIYTLVNQGVIGYTILGLLSTRSLDSWIVFDEGSSAHLARQHMDN
jgi:hypothetical protein